MKRMSILLAVCFMFLAVSVAYAAQPQKVVFNISEKGYHSDGKFVAMDAQSFITKGSAFVPLRYLAQSLGVEASGIAYADKTRQVTINNGIHKLVLQTGSMKMLLDGSQKTIPAAPVNKAGRLYLPARAVAEALGYAVSFDKAAVAVIIEKVPVVAQPQTYIVIIKDMKFTPDKLTIHAGDTVTWRNDDGMPHTATGTTFDSQILNTGDEYSHTFDSKGTYAYNCTIHPFMQALVIVE